MGWDEIPRSPRLRWVILLSWMIPVALASCAVGQEIIVGSDSPSRRLRLPDGPLGLPSVSADASYASVSGKGMISGDYQTYGAHLRLPARPQVCFLLDWQVTTRDSTRHELSGGFKFYLADPWSRSANPDGAIMRPMLRMEAGHRFFGSTGSNGYWLGRVSASLPISHFLTLSGGYSIFDVEEITEVGQAFGQMSLYFADYGWNQRFVNPDGPAGYLAVELQGGGSSVGYFGQSKFLLPLNLNTTVAVVGRGEWLDEPSQKSLSAGFELTIYPN